VLRNSAVTTSKGEPLVSRSGNGPVTITVSGQVSRSGSAESPLSIPIVDPGAFFASTLRTVLATEGIEVVGGTRRERVRDVNGAVPADFEVLAVHEQRLPELIERMNTNSLNMCAEALLKTLGAYSQKGRVVQQGSLATGRAAAAKFLETLGLGSELYVLDDGSGLSRDNRAAAVVFARILKHMDGHPLRKVWWDSLAEAGDAEGSLKRRMKDLGDQVCGKTGHINNVATLSGYVVGPGGRRYAFSVLCNDTSRAKGGTSAAHKLQDEVCRLLATAER
jgi:D-alanyl-D-alanine carboxypeptidase/D-alanyl-D-alanine-endopeptidase (penicillin-binding protein 4)